MNKELRYGIEQKKIVEILGKKERLFGLWSNRGYNVEGFASSRWGINASTGFSSCPVLYQFEIKNNLPYSGYFSEILKYLS